MVNEPRYFALPFQQLWVHLLLFVVVHQAHLNWYMSGIYWPALPIRDVGEGSNLSIPTYIYLPL